MKRRWQHITFLLIIVVTLLACTSCHKNCRCYGFDGTVTDFTRDEVNDGGGSCPSMIAQYDMRYYSLCEWD
ncbi:MAG: hypothetical protein KBT04_01550 [Bacteroidales bacterium]|nr:hypothetical protein [Candidatus Colimorpha onthohippi]